MPERSNKRNKSHSALSDKAEESSRELAAEAGPGSPKWRIKSSCLWLIPGDVPGQRRMPAPPPEPPAPLTILPFKPKPVKLSPVESSPVEPVEINAESEANVVPDSPQLKPEQFRSESHSKPPQVEDKPTSIDAVNSNVSASERVSKSTRSINATNTSTSTSKHTINAPVKHKRANTKSLDNLIKEPSDTSLSIDNTEIMRRQPVSNDNDINTIDKINSPAEKQLNRTDKTASLLPQPEANYASMPVVDMHKHQNYRKFLPALLLLLLMAGLGGIAVDYLSNQNDVASVAAIEDESVALMPPDTIQPIAIPLPQSDTPVYDSLEKLPAVEISVSSLEHQAIGGIQMMTHIVVRGDTLWDISKSYLKNPFRYPELAQLSSIKNPDLIYPGDIVHIHIRVDN